MSGVSGNSVVEPFSLEQARAAVNLRQFYETWIDARRRLAGMPYGMRWKTINGSAYLYEIRDRDGNGSSLGPRSPDTESRLADYQDAKSALQDRIRASGASLLEVTRLWRPLRLPMLDAMAARLLLEADLRGLLGPSLLVVGTNAMVAYAMEASGRLRNAPDTTEDFDMTWRSTLAVDGARPVWDMLRSVDPTFTQNSERLFQARNRAGYEFELLAAPSTIIGMARKDRPSPIPLPEQEWLMLGQPVSAVIVGVDGTPAPIVAPDPRWFSLQKLWLSQQSKRNPLKRAKDEQQGMLVLFAVRDAMPHYPLDGAFEAALPPELEPHYARWKALDDARAKTDIRPAWMSW